MSFKTFRRDAALGNVAELEIMRLFNGCGLKTTPVSVENRRFWDLESSCPSVWKVPENKFTIEVKYDMMYSKTGNLAIEVWNTKKNEAAGIKLTKATLWAHHLTDSIWICRTSDLLTFIENVKPKRVVENAGDGNAMVMLYEGEEILSAIFHEVTKISKKDFVSKIRKLCKIT